MSVRQQLHIGIGITACLSGLLLALGHVAVPPRTDRAAVMALLDQREIAYADVTVRAGDPGVPQDQFAYVAAVVVAAEPPAYGTIVCESRLEACVVWIESLGVRQIALPRVVASEPWPVQLRRALRQATGRLRSWLRPDQPSGRVLERGEDDTKERNHVPNRA